MLTFPITVTENGVCYLTLTEAVPYKGKRHDLVLEWRRRDSIWDREALGHVPIVSSLHEFSVSITTEGILAKGRIDPDFWSFVHGPMKLNVSADSYRGQFGEEAVSGIASFQWEDAPRPSLGARQAPLQILDDFRQYQGAGRLYDYRHVGRHTSHDLPDLPIFQATDYGVEADSGKECLSALQQAIDAAGDAGGGIVQLPAGVLDANVETKLPYLSITKPRVYIRGSGSGPDGTILVNHRYSDTPDPKAPWRAGEHPLIKFGGAPEEYDPKALKPLCAVTTGKRGKQTISVDNANELSIGQHIILRQLEDAEGSLALDLVQHQVQPAGNYLGEGRPLVTQLARIEDIDGTTIRLDAPLHRDITRWSADLCSFPLLEQVGICDLRIAGHWGGFFIHHKNGEHDNGWDQIKFHHVAYGLVANVLCESTTSAVGLANCLGCIVRDCRIEGNLGHNGFVLSRSSTGNLFLRCHAGHNMHGFNIQGNLSGNALVDCSMDEPSGIDLHGGIGCDTLVDNMSGGVLKGGGGPGAVPPRHGPGFTLWNWRTGHYDPYKIWKRSDVFASHDQTPGYTIVGMHGAYGQLPQLKTPTGMTSEDHYESWGWSESHGQRVSPRSLYGWLLAEPRFKNCSG